MSTKNGMELGEEGEGVGRGERERETPKSKCMQCSFLFPICCFFAVNHQIESDMINTASIHTMIY